MIERRVFLCAGLAITAGGIFGASTAAGATPLKVSVSLELPATIGEARAFLPSPGAAFGAAIPLRLADVDADAGRIALVGAGRRGVLARWPAGAVRLRLRATQTVFVTRREAAALEAGGRPISLRVSVWTVAGRRDVACTVRLAPDWAPVS